MISNRAVKRATMWSSITELMSRLVSPIVNIILARLLLPEEFGVVATITLVISFAEVFTDAGFQKYIIQHEFNNVAELDKSTNVAFWTNLAISIFACTIIFVFRNTIARIVGSPRLGIPISIASLLIILHAFSSVQMSRYKRDLDFRTLFFVRIGTTLIPLVVTVPLAIILKNFWALLIGNFLSQIFNAVVLTIKSKWKIRLYYNFRLFKDMFSFSVWTLLESISIWFTANVDIFLVSNYLSAHYVGLYKTAMTTISSYMSLITAAVIPVLFSALSREQNDRKRFQNTYYSFQKISSMFVIPMGVGIFIFSEFVTMVLLGEKWLEASGFIGWWGLTSSFAILFSSFSSEVIRSKGKPLISLLIQISQILLMIPVLIMVKNLGFRVLYVARSLVRFELMIAFLIILCIMFDFEFKKIVKNILPSLVSSIIMGGIGVSLVGIREGIVWQVVSIIVCMVAYFIVLLVFPQERAFLLNKLQQILKAVICQLKKHRF